MKPCKRCRGSGVWLPERAEDNGDADIVSRACIYCDGTGEVPTLEEERAAWALEARHKLFKGRREEPTEAHTAASVAGPEGWLRLVRGWWERDREARIRAGAWRSGGPSLTSDRAHADRGCTAAPPPFVARGRRQVRLEPGLLSPFEVPHEVVEQRVIVDRG